MASEKITTSDGVALELHAWPVEGTPRALVAIVHGYGEHGERYAHVAKALNAAQVSALAVDLRGHGRSAGRRGYVARFSDYHRDLDALLEAARSRAGGKPIFILCHSMGALATMHYLLHGGAKDVAGVLVSSPFLGVALAVPAVKIIAGKLMSRLWPTLAIPTGIKGNDVTRDAEEAAKYERDPLNNKNATARWYTESLAAIELVLSRGRELDKPMLLIYGGDDKTASASKTDELAAKLGMKDRSIERVEGGAHELVNDEPATRARVIQRIVGWVVEHAG